MLIVKRKVYNFKNLKIFIIPATVIFLDQITKYLVKKHMVLGESTNIFGNFLCFTYIENRGMAFGISTGNATFFTVLSIIVTIFLFYYLYKIRGKRFLYRFPFFLILGGAIGNLIDRVLYNKVVDFIDVNIPDISIPSLNLFLFQIPKIELHRWPIFNIADSAITIGMIVLLIIIFSHKEFLEEK